MKKRILLIFILLSEISFGQYPNICFKSMSENRYSKNDYQQLFDINKDGILDLIGITYASNAVANTFLGNGYGGFTAVLTSTIPSWCVQFAINDFNEDGHEDLALITQNTGSFYIALGNGTGSFNYSGANYLVDSYPNYTRSITSNDFNNDGHKDLIVSTFKSAPNNLKIFLGSGSATFSVSDHWEYMPSQWNVFNEDLNNDGNIDIITYDGSNNNILIGSGLGTFNTTSSFSGLQVSAIKDLNNDGFKDLVTSAYGQFFSVRFNNGSGSFTTTASYNVGAGNDIRSAVSIDVDNNNTNDIVAFDYTNKNIVTYKNSGTGTFSFFSTTPSLQDLAFTVSQLTVGDLDNDNVTDIVTSLPSVILGKSNGYFDIYPREKTNCVSSNGISCILTQEINNDGFEDIVYPDSIGCLRILYGNGTTGFSGSKKINVGNAYYINSIVSLDLNNDNKNDLLAVQGNTIYSLFYDGTNSFGSITSFTPGSATSISIAGADFNGDNNNDIVVGLSSKNYVSVFFGNGNGGFGAASNYTYSNYGGGASDVLPVCVDLNMDGKPDLVTANRNNNAISVLMNTGSGSFYLSMSGGLGSGVDYPRAVQAVDMNKDGKKDVVLLGGNGTLKIYYNDGLGGFASTLSIAVNVDSETMTIEDFNNDGNIDISIGNISPYTGGMEILVGNSNGTVSNYRQFQTGAKMFSVAKIDINRDGAKDLIMGSNTNLSQNYLDFFFNTTAIFTPGSNLSSVCQATNNVLRAVKGGFNYQWNPINSSKDSIMINGLQSLYSYTVSNQSGSCVSISKTLTITVNPTPTITVVSDTNFICSGKSVQLSANGANTYTWSTGAITPSITETLNATTTYSVKGANSYNCIGTTTTQIRVNQNPVISANSATICEGQSFTISPSGASTYSYSGGSGIVSPIANSTYTISGEDANGCVGTVTTQVAVNPKPTIMVVSSSVCVGTSASLIASGASTYAWSTGATTNSIVITPTVTETYTVMGTDVNNCSNTQTVSVTIDNTCSDVWPGDANSDGTADNLDVLELGLHYTQTGAPRANNSNSWQSYFANNWTGTITNGKNLNHSDCNGDGMINDNDTLAIYNNYGLTHAFKPAQTTTVNPQLSIIPDQTSVVKGTWGTSSIYLGDAATNINNINGVAFTVDFDNSLIEPSNIWIEYLPSFIDASQNLHFRKLDFANSKLYTATTHTVNSNVSGNGLIAKLHYQIKSNLATDQVLNLGISQANQSNASGTIIPLTSGTGTLMALGASVGLQELNGGLISMSPNPTNGSLTINSKTELQKIEVVAITGQVLLSEVPTNVYHTLHLDNFANGIYFVNVYQNDLVVKREKIVLNK